MSSGGLTRRSLLTAAAGMVAARPAGVLAALAARPQTLLRERRLGRLAAGTHTVELEGPVDLVGLQWQQPASADVQLRVRGEHGRWSPWVSAVGHGHGPDSPAPTTGHVGDPIWLGGARIMQLRSVTELWGACLQLIDVGVAAGRRGPMAWPSATLPLAGPTLAAGPGQPPIIARRVWAEGVSHPEIAPQYGAVKLAFVHHTENPNGYSPDEVPAMLRAIYLFHRYVNGWDDIGYNFVIDLYGRIFEARAGGIDEPVVGAHAGGYNLVSTGIAVLGSFMSTPISEPAHRSLERLLAWKLSLHGVPSRGSVTVRVNPEGAAYSRFPANARVSLPRIAGHRDGDSTDCPGDVLYGELAGVRSAVHRLAPNPVRTDLALLATVPGAPGEVEGIAAQAATLSGSLTLLDGTPVSGAPVQLQMRRVAKRGESVVERTVAELVSDAQGHFETAAAIPGVSGRVWLRALCPGLAGVGASVSEPIKVDLAGVSPPGAAVPIPPAAGPAGS